ncbi:nucleoside phosphorylase domain-containing protein [Aspergillus novoparasiticus]|uniref:Nucleoside phosphorylase domain-containing protein n=1 Tax=Aspergillus novoparasiticus TaxID=986946 RepID=A0A5N6ESZ1_9EURO|nr:nucleoside phosphorylase domain-containing protein [Aspergillus novoparasiticus]
MLPRCPDPDEFEVCIICASPLEADAVCSMFDETYKSGSTVRHTRDQTIHPQKYDYIMGRSAGHNVVLARLPGMGIVYSAGESRHLKERFKRIKLALLVGICGAVPKRPDRQEISLGDVIISRDVIRYDLGKQYPFGFQWTDASENSCMRPNGHIREFVAKLEVRREKLEGRACLPCVDQGCDLNLLVPRNPPKAETSDNNPALHFGNFASEEIVMDYAEDPDEIAQLEYVIAFETKAVGAWDNLPCMIVKGVRDYADGYVSEEWEQYAAATAVACAKAILEEWIASPRWNYDCITRLHGLAMTVKLKLK